MDRETYVYTVAQSRPNLVVRLLGGSQLWDYSSACLESPVGRPPSACLLKCSHTEQLSWECSTHWNAPIIVMLVACHEMFLLHENSFL